LIAWKTRYAGRRVKTSFAGAAKNFSVLKCANRSKEKYAIKSPRLHTYVIVATASRKSVRWRKPYILH
jgi:hypothetical protein